MDCPICGMGYIPEIPEDRRQHKTYHDRYVNGIPGRSIKGDKVVWKMEDLRICVVNDLSNRSQRLRAEELAKLEKLDNRFDGLCFRAFEPPDERNVHAFILYKTNRGIGLLIIEKFERNTWIAWQDYDSHAKYHRRFNKVGNITNMDT